MNKYKLIGLYLLMLIAMACGSKKKLTTVDIQREKVSYVLPTDNKLSIETLCDSLGNPVQVERVITNATGTTSITIKDNKLEVVTLTDTIYKDKYVYKDKLVTSEVVRKQVDWKFVFIALGVIVLFCIFPGIPRAINTIAIKLIRGF